MSCVLFFTGKPCWNITLNFYIIIKLCNLATELHQGVILWDTEKICIACCIQTSVCKDKNLELCLSTLWRRIGGAQVYLHAFLSSVVYGSEWSNYDLTALRSWKQLFVPIKLEAGWGSGVGLFCRRREKSLDHAGNGTRARPGRSPSRCTNTLQMTVSASCLKLSWRCL
jgi:hypothetical protein